jgi:hypothetical protein
MERTAERVQQASGMTWTWLNLWALICLPPTCAILELTTDITQWNCNSTKWAQHMIGGRGNHIVQHSRWADCTQPRQNWWSNKGRENFTSVWWGRGGTLSWPSLCRGKAVQLQSGENTTQSTTLKKLVVRWNGQNSHEKQSTKKLNSISRAHLVGGRGRGLLYTNYSWDYFRKEPTKINWARRHIPARRAWILPPKQIPPTQKCLLGRGNIHCYTYQHINLKKRRWHREKPCQKCQHLD